MFCIQERRDFDAEREEYKISSNQQSKKKLRSRLDSYSYLQTQESRKSSEGNNHKTETNQNQQRILKASMLAEQLDQMRRSDIFISNNSTCIGSNYKSKNSLKQQDKVKSQDQNNLEYQSDTGDDDRLIIKPHPREFYLKLIEIEKKISKGQFFQFDITLLIELYTKCVEYFDSVQDPIKCYFEDKISSTLSSTNILSVLLKPQQQFEQKKGLSQSEIKEKDNKQNQVDNQFLDKDIVKQNSYKSFERVNPNEKNRNKPRTLSYHKKQESIKGHYNIEHIKMQDQTEIEKSNVLKDQEKKIQVNLQHKQNVISQQSKEIQERLRQRKEKNLISKSEKLLSCIKFKTAANINDSMSSDLFISSKTLNTYSSSSSEQKLTEEDIYDQRSMKNHYSQYRTKYTKTQDRMDVSIEKQNYSDISPKSLSLSPQSHSPHYTSSSKQNIDNVKEKKRMNIKLKSTDQIEEQSKEECDINKQQIYEDNISNNQ